MIVLRREYLLLLISYKFVANVISILLSFKKSLLWEGGYPSPTIGTLKH